MRKNSRECRKCGNNFPHFIKIDGRTRDLKNRKFCLDCSPFGSSNRMRDDPSRSSNTSKAIKNYKNWSEDKKNIHRLRVLKKKYDKKIKLVEIHGGKCVRCGYKKCLRSLHFHHRDPKTKSFELNIGSLSKNWETIVQEAEKCDLVCANCHGEIENSLSPINMDLFENIIKDGVESGEISGFRRKREKKKCLSCGSEFEKKNKGQTYCSNQCRGKDRRKVRDRPDAEGLKILIDNMSWEAVGREYGVSGNTIRKWAKQYGLLG